MATGVRHLLAAYPPETLGPGDVLITNDPWMTSGQLNDFTVVTPVFREGRIVGYFGNLCHAADIGGQVFSGEAHEIYEEVARPGDEALRPGEPNQELLKIIRANVRLPDETVGDLYAQASCNDVGGRALLTMMDEFGLESIDPSPTRSSPAPSAPCARPFAPCRTGSTGTRSGATGSRSRS